MTTPSQSKDTVEVTQAALRCCPFDEAAAEMRHWDWPYERWQARCTKCKATCGGRKASEAEAAAVWNERAAQSKDQPSTDRSAHSSEGGGGNWPGSSTSAPESEFGERVKGQIAPPRTASKDQHKPDSGEVERVAEAMWRVESIRASGRDRLVPWAEANPEIADGWRDLARAAIQALRGSGEELREAGGVDAISDEQLRWIAESKDTGTCRERIRAALRVNEALHRDTEYLSVVLARELREGTRFPSGQPRMSEANAKEIAGRALSKLDSIIGGEG